MATNTVTTEQVREAIEQLAAMVVAGSISPQTVADILEMMRNLNDQEREKLEADATAYIQAIHNTGITAGLVILESGDNVEGSVPEIKNDDKDLAITDETNKAIVLFCNGHVKTKNFDSESAIEAIENKVEKVAGKGLSTNDFTTNEKDKLAGIDPNAEVNDVETSASSEGVDYEIADENGYVLAQFKDGHIKTKEFDSSNIPTPTPTPSQDSPVDVESNEDEDFSIGDGEGYDILKVKNGHIKTKKFDSSQVNEDIATINASITKYSNILPQITRDNRVYTYVHVGAGYTYQHVQDAINSITDASESKLYMVVVHDDIYVNSITQLRKESNPTQSMSASDPYNTLGSYIWMKDYVSLMGANGRQVKIEVHIPLSELETSQGETARSPYVHACYARGSFTMKDIFFRCSNTRYCIHQENGQDQTTGKDINAYKEYINVKLEYLTGVSHINAMGVGLASNLRVLWENCTFIDHVAGAINTLHTHLNYPYPCEYTIRNCRIIGLNGKGGNQGFQDLCSGKRHKFVIEGCEMTSWQHVNGAYGSNLSVSDACHDVRNVGAKLSGHSNYACMGIVELPVLVLKSSVITDTIVVDSESSAYADLWGGNYKEYKGMVVGREYMPYSTSYKGLNMGTRLGNCSTTNKTLVVTINGTDITITFNRDYTDISNTDIIAEINTALAGTNVVASNTFREQRLYFEDEVAFVKNTGSTPIQIDDFVSLNGSASVAVQTGTQNVYGIAAERIDPDEFGTIILKGKQKFKQLRWVNPSNVGVMYKVVDNSLATTTTQSEALFVCTEKVSTYNVLEWAKNVL